MGIVSYAQNFEDVLLNRVFGSVHYAVYVDIGAYHPTDDSVTKTFYDRGWDGINIEPGDVFDQLAAARPRDINLHMAVYDHAGTISFVQHAGWYAGLSHVQAETPAPGEPAGQPAVEVRTVPCDTLTNILDRYGSGRPIAFLKIDAEGSEEAIVRSTNWRVIRPTVILIEATKPRSTVLDNQRWEPVLLEQGYQRAYFDGINCFYVPEERADLLRHFELPVNVLDGFQHHSPELAAAYAKIETSQVRVCELVADLTQSKSQHDRQLEQYSTLERELGSTTDQLRSTKAQLETTGQHLETVSATQNAMIAALVEANAYQLADLRRQLAEVETRCNNLIQERDALLSVRDQALQLRRLLRELQWPDGPTAIRAVLPLARLLRLLVGTKVPPVPPEELALFAPSSVATSIASPVAAVGTTRPPRRSIAKRAAWFAYRPLRPLGRPVALRLRAFLMMHIHSEFGQLDQKLNRILEEMGQIPTGQSASTSPSR